MLLLLLLCVNLLVFSLSLYLSLSLSLPLSLSLSLSLSRSLSVHTTSILSYFFVFLPNHGWEFAPGASIFSKQVIHSSINHIYILLEHNYHFLYFCLYLSTLSHYLYLSTLPLSIFLFVFFPLFLLFFSPNASISHSSSHLNLEVCLFFRQSSTHILSSFLPEVFWVFEYLSINDCVFGNNR